MEVQNFNITDDEYLRLQRGDQRLQTRVFDKYAGHFVSIAVRQFGLSTPDAEEIVSSAFAKLFCKILRGELAKENLAGYVFTIVKHKCFENTANKKKNILETTDLLPETIEKEADDDLMSTINVAFGRLGEKCQKLLSAIYWEEKDHKDMAIEYNITEEASRQRKRECMKKLRVLVMNNGL